MTYGKLLIVLEPHAPETWLDLERLAAMIYAELDADSEVTHNASLLGELSETERQIDVLVENQANGTRAIIDCKDWRKKADVNDVGSFASLVEDVGASSGTLICNRGFSRAAIAFARNKGISLCQLNDVESRKWRLDVLMPVVWTQTQVTSLEMGIRVRLLAGDSLPTQGMPTLQVEGRGVDPLQSFVDMWNQGVLVAPAGGRTGTWSGETPVELVTLERNVRYALFEIKAGVIHRSRLGYLPPRDSRGIVDFDTGSYQTVRLNTTTTLLQHPEDGWRDIGDPSELAIHPKATVLSLQETQGITAEWRGIHSVMRVGD